RVDRVFQLEDFALDVDGDLARQIAVGDGGGDLGDVAHLGGEVVGHRVDVISEIFPGAGHAGDVGLAAEPALGADLARNARDLGGEGVELIDHRVDRVFQLQDFALDIDGDLARQVAARDGRGHLGDIAYLRGQVR